jgi:hypothetical protein
VQLIVQQQHEEFIRDLNERLDRMDEASVRALQDIEEELTAVRRAREQMLEHAYRDEQGRAIFMKADESAAFYEDGAQVEDDAFAAIRDQLRGRPTWDDLQDNFDKEGDLLDEADQIHANDALRNQIEEDVAAGRVTDTEAERRIRDAETSAPERLRNYLAASRSDVQPAKTIAADFSEDEFAQASARSTAGSLASVPKPI